jgi:hypothetical protein
VKEDYIFLIHAYAYERLAAGASFQEVVEYLRANNVNVNDVQVIDAIRVAYSLVFVDSSRTQIMFNPDDTMKRRMQIEAYFRYLEYMELAESRQNAEEAKGHAQKAILLTLAALFVSIVIGLIQINLQLASQ